MADSPEISWGVLGFARIFQKRMMPAFEKRKSAHCVKALSSRSPAQAGTYAQDHHIPDVYETHEEVLNDASIQAVYIPLPNSLHHRWIEKAANKGKHILCEKPLAYDRNKTARLLDLCKDRKVVLMESHSYHLHPQHAALAGLVEDDVIGDIRQIQLHFSFPAGPEHAIRFDAILGGGALLDLGCYGIDFMHRFTQQDPISRWTKFDNADGVDMEFTGAFKFNDKREVEIKVSFLQARQQTMIITGEKGSLFLPSAFIPSGSRAFIHVNNDKGSSIHEVENSDQYALLLDEFYNTVMHNDVDPARYRRYLRNACLLEDLLKERVSL